MIFKEFEKRIRMLGMTRQEFARKANIGSSTVNGWSMEGRRIPPWVGSFLDLIEENRDFRSTLKVLNKIKNGDIRF